MSTECREAGPGDRRLDALFSGDTTPDPFDPPYKEEESS
jgi:hypothetical protein